MNYKFIFISTKVEANFYDKDHKCSTKYYVACNI